VEEVEAIRAAVDLAAAAVEVASEDRLLCMLVDQFTKVLGDRCTVWLTTEGELMPASASSHPDAVQDRVQQLPSTESRVEIHDSGNASMGWLAEHGFRQLAMVPIQRQASQLGFLALTRDLVRDAFTEDELAVAAALGEAASLAIHTSRLIHSMMAAVEDMRNQTEVTDRMSDALIACDVGYRVVDWNAGAERVYGYTQGEVVDCDLFALLNTTFHASGGLPLSREDANAAIGRDQPWQGELHERRADGARLVVLSAITPHFNRAGEHVGFILVNRDVTAQRREEYQALHDALTDLPNRRLLQSRLYDAIARAGRGTELLAVLFVDLNGFKPVNDVYGHAAGDEVLKAVAIRLLSAVRQNDTVGRLGGDEFLVIIEEAHSQADVEHVIGRIHQSLIEPIAVGDVLVTVSASVGLATADNNALDEIQPERLIEAADAAMYVAKREHHGPVVRAAQS
jgi:diguanylate cyclase (GGDEF)-like protein/PAS domain S-box-containing protein